MTDSAVKETTVSEHTRSPRIFNFVSLGADSLVYKAQNNVALKYASSDSDEEIRDNFARENSMYEIFEKHEWTSPYILQSLFRDTSAIYTLYMPGRTLDQRIRANQETKGWTVKRVLRLEPRAKVEQWCVELAAAMSFLETLNLAHGDLRLTNVSLDNEDHIKLADFDSTASFGSPCFGGCAPWWRILGPEGGSEHGDTGDPGVRTESFGYGSIVYTVSHGHEPYEPYEPDEDPTEIIRKFRYMRFPALSEDLLDVVIGKCWNNSYVSLKELESETSRLFGIVAAACVQRLHDPLLESLRDWCREINNTVHLATRCMGARKTPDGYNILPEICTEQHDGGVEIHD
jgi:atypical protein kinase C zeta type